MAASGEEGNEVGIRKIPVMERILIFIKHHFGFLWKFIEWANGVLFSLFYRLKMEKALAAVFDETDKPQFTYRKLVAGDAESLFKLIGSQEEAELRYFHPHDFDLASIQKQFKIGSFLMMGVLDNDKLIGYFFLRFFANKKCFVGRLIDKDYRGKGIGPVMNTIMYETAWKMGFRCLSTISRNNALVMRAHAKNKKMVILKELQNDYLLVEFIRKPEIE
jgi:hypothetical protein